MPEADTIFAVASGSGRAAITVVRISGAYTGTILRCFCGVLPPPRRASLRHLLDEDGELLDRAMVIWMPGPASYTGQDCAELSLHGGHAVLEAVSEALVHLGARPAEAGEFSRRAFLAGRMDLVEAEAVADLVGAETQGQRVQALRQLDGVAGAMLAGWAERLRRALAFQEALIDFPDEGLPAGLEAGLLGDLAALRDEFCAQASAADRGDRLRAGLVFAVTGAPNVGKSSLVNALAGRDVAIVSPTPGTTRDAIETVIVIDGVKVTLVDTAGLRESDDPVEAEGVRRARARAASADLVIVVMDASAPDAGTGGSLIVANKIDLAPAPAGTLGISVRTAVGLEALHLALVEAVRRLAHPGAGPVLSRARHAAALRDAARHLDRALDCTLAELRGEELRLSLRALGRITGAVDAEAILDTVFSSFCIGK